MLKPENVHTKGRPAGVPAAKPAPSPSQAPAAPTCRLCGKPCPVVALAMEPGWEVQECECSGRQRRRAVKAEG